MLFAKDFLKLQFIFALKISEIFDLSYIDALFDYTSLPVRVGVPFADMTKTNPNWVKFANKVKSIADFEVAYEHHVSVMKDASPMRTQFGCFSYDYVEDEKLVRLHFANNDTPEPGVLSDERLQTRLLELTKLFEDVKKNHSDTLEVTSSSWLYNIPKFKRLFPDEFFQNVSVKWDFRSLGIWGQFLDKYGQVKKESMEMFIDKVNNAKTFEELKDAFPLKDVKCWTYIRHFFAKYGITS